MARGGNKKTSAKLLKRYGWKKALSRGYIRIGGRGTMAIAITTAKGKRRLKRMRRR